jgi:subfamily B ATP-binding cassette protein MsbA
MNRFRPYLRHLRPVRGHLILAFVCLAIFAVTTGFGLPWLIPTVFGPIFQGELNPATGLFERHLSFWEVTRWTMLVPLIFIVRGVAGFGGSYLFQLIGTRVLEAIRLDYFRKLQVLPLSYLQGQRAGDLTARGLADTQQVQSALTMAASEGVKHPLTLVAALGAVVYFALQAEGVVLALVTLALVPVCVFPVRHAARKVLRRAQQAQAAMGSISAQIAENLGAAREVRAFGLEERAVGRFAATSHALLTAQLKVAKYVQLIGPAVEIISSFGIALTLVYAYRSGIDIKLLGGVLVALYQCYEPVKRLGLLKSELERGRAALERLEPVLNEPVGLADPDVPANVTRLRGDLDFGGVSFAYKTDTLVLRDISIRIPAGTVCALVGRTGAGKTTFANLVPRFYDATAGTVKVDGHDVRDLRLADLRRNLALVSQETVLFHDSILNNILLGRPQATRAEAEQAARNSHAHGFIMAFPQGYDTVVGERGASLSGGQRQRIALARAFLRDAPILILDEATSALDSESEAAVQAALKQLMAGRTVLIIAHRFSTIRDASLILVFDQGRIVAVGPHAQLYAANSLYKSLYDQQQSSSAT